MRKNLLLTTALVGVAFAFPAMANEAENPPADTTTTKQEAIYTNETGTTVADGTVFEGLKQESADSQNAGAVTVNTQGSIVIGNDVKFLGNNSIAAGGAMKALSGFEIGNNVTFEGNTSEKGGGALYIRQSPQQPLKSAMAPLSKATKPVVKMPTAGSAARLRLSMRRRGLKSATMLRSARTKLSKAARLPYGYRKTI